MPAALQPYRHPLAQPVHSALEQGRFLDAWSLAQPHHQNAAVLKTLTCEEQVLAARLCWSLGGMRLAHALFRRAEQRDPKNPIVRLYQATYSGKRVDYLKQLQAFEESPHLDSGDAAVDAQWLAGNALLYSIYRDFERAHAVLDQAEQIHADLPQLAMARGQIYLHQDDIEKAWPLAQTAWRRSPAFPSHYRLFLEVASRRNQEPQAAQALLHFVLKGGQSGHALCLALLTLCRGLERLPPHQAAAAAARLEPHCVHIPRLMPLLDKASDRLQAALQAEFAKLTLNRKGFIDLAKKARLPHHHRLVEAYQRHPNGERLLLTHATPRQKHNTCVPGSITACLQTLGMSIDQDAVAAEITYDGTQCWRVAAWARRKNLLFYPFISERATHLALLRAGLPAVMTYHQPGNMGHAVAIVGYDEATDSLIYHDPSCAGLGERALTALLEQNAPDGPLCFVVAPPQWQARLEAMNLHRTAVAGDFLGFLESLSTQASTETWKRGVQFQQRHGNDPLAALVAIQCEVMQGNWAKALEVVIEALREAPQSMALTRLYLDVRARYHDSDAYERALEAVVEGEPLPDLPVVVKAPWSTGAVAELANLLYQSHSSSARAEHFLNLGLSVNPTAAELLAVKVNILSRRGSFEAAAFFSRLTTTLQPTNPYFINEYVWLLRKLGRREQALKLLAERAEKGCKQAGGSEGWINAVNLTAQFGEPDRAADLLKRGLMRRRQDGDLWAFAATFCLQHGLIQSAEQAWQKTQQYCRGELKQRTGFYRFFHLGQYKEAAVYLEAWLKADPEDLTAREMKMAFVHRVQGAEAAKRLPEQWHRAHPDSKRLHLFYLQHNDSNDLAALDAWLTRHPRDTWGQRAHLAAHLNRFNQVDKKARALCRQQVEDALARAWSEDPFHPHTRLLKAQWLVVLEDWEGAGTLVADLLCDDPDDETALQLLILVFQRRDRIKRPEFIDILERCFTACRHDFQLARTAAFAVDQLLGFKAAHALLTRWRAARPDDPYVIEAFIDLNMERGEGLRSLTTVKNLLAEMVKRFPRHKGFSQSLVEYYRQAQKPDQITSLYQTMIARTPTDLGLRFDMAVHLQRINQREAAKRELSTIIRLFPFEEQAWLGTCQMLNSLGYEQDAQALLAKALERLPQSAALHRQRFKYLQSVGNVAAIRQAAFQLDRHLHDPLEVARLQAAAFDLAALEISDAKKIAVSETILERDPSDWPATYRLFAIYLDSRQFTKARTILRNGKRFHGGLVDLAVAETLLERHSGDKQAALEKLVKVLERDIDNSWGRGLAIQWIAEDNALELGHDLLLFFDQELTCREDLAGSRVSLATVLGFPHHKIVDFWEGLCQSYPHTASLHGDYLNWLINQQAWQEAQTVYHKLKQLESNPTITGHYGLLLAVGLQDLNAVQRGLREVACGTGPQISGELLNSVFKALCESGLLHTLSSRLLQETGAGVQYHSNVYLVMAIYANGNKWLDICLHMLENLIEIKATWPELALLECLNAFQKAGEHEEISEWMANKYFHWKNRPALISKACSLAIDGEHWDWVAAWTEDWQQPDLHSPDVAYMRLMLERFGWEKGANWQQVARIGEYIVTHHAQSNCAAATFYTLCIAYLAMEKTNAFQTTWQTHAQNYREELGDKYRVLKPYVTLFQNPEKVDQTHFKAALKQWQATDQEEKSVLYHLYDQHFNNSRGSLNKALGWFSGKLKR